MKEAFYFPHDNNAINDPKLMSVLMSVGLSGIGLYWIIIESMHQQESGMITVDQYREIIEWYSRGSEPSFVEHVLNTYSKNDLFVFTSDGKVFSKRVVENKKFREELIEKRRNAGKASAEKRASAKENQETVPTSVEHMLNTGGTRKGKERKGNKKEITETEEKYIKEKEILEFWKSFSKNIQHDESKKILESIEKALGKFSFDKIKRGIEVYSKVVSNPECFFSYRWTLEEFLKREGGLNTFCEKNVSDYVKNPGKSQIDHGSGGKMQEIRQKEHKEKLEEKKKKQQITAENESILRWFNTLPEDSALKIEIEKAIDENKTIKKGFEIANQYPLKTLLYEQKLEAAQSQRERLKIAIIRQYYQ